MTKSEINTFTFWTNIFGQFCYISILTIWLKKQSRRKALWSFLNIMLHKLR